MNGRWVVGAVVVTGLVAGTGWLVSPGGAAEDAQNTDVRTVRATVGDVGATVLATGVIRPMIGSEVRVGSQVSGVLVRLDATVGQRVAAGQVLAQLDSSLFRAAVDREAATLDRTRGELTFARTQHDRARELASSGAISADEMAKVERDLAVARAAVATAEADLRFARLQLERTTIRAPIGGVVASVSTQVGETVAASFAAPTFLTIIDLERLEVWAYVDETDIGRVEVGQRARFTVDTYPDTEFTGVVTAIRPQAEVQDAVVNYVTVIDVDPVDGRTLRPEMTTTTNILLSGRANVLRIPNTAVRRDARGAFVYLLNSDGSLRTHPVELGLRGSDETEITNGLREGEAVVVGPVPSRLRPEETR